MFTKAQLNNMLEEYQSFICRGVEITSPIHANGPDLCRQLLSLKQKVSDFLEHGTMRSLKELQKELS